MACSFQGSLLHLPSSTGTKLLNSNGSYGNCNSDMFNGCKARNRTTRRKHFSMTRASTFFSEDLRPQLNEYPEGIISGEWPENFSLLSYADLREYFESQPTTEKVQHSALLGDVMSTPIRTATPNQTLEEINHHFENISGLPVVDAEFRCVGVICKGDRAKASQGSKTTVGEVMSSPAITLSPDKTVVDAAALMLKEEVHRIPILNKENQVIGIVSRTDVFKALELVDLSNVICA